MTVIDITPRLEAARRRRIAEMRVFAAPVMRPDLVAALGRLSLLPLLTTFLIAEETGRFLAAMLGGPEAGQEQRPQSSQPSPF